MGVDKVYSGTQILADIIEQEVDFEGLRVVLKIERSNKSIIEFKLSARSVACGKTLEAYDFPGDSKIVMITHADGTVEMPRGNLIMQPDDTFLMIADSTEFNAIMKTMIRK